VAHELQDARARDFAWKTAEFSKALKRLLKAPVKSGTADFLGAELAQMIGDELRIEQAKPSMAEPSHKVDQRDLARACLIGKHALAEKGASERDAIESARKLTIEPSLHGMAIAHFEKFGVEFTDALVDPGCAAAGLCRRATLYNGFVIAVDTNLELILPDNAGEPFRDMKLVETKNAPPFGFDPIKRRILGALRHRKYAAGIGFKQNLWRYLDR
jgi:hypothetical protein